MMREALDSLAARYDWTVPRRTHIPPVYGLARVQWDGPWLKPGVPAAAAYCHTHWVGSRWNPEREQQVFDINAMCVGGWISFDAWQQSLVPWLLEHVEPKATGAWWFTHVVEVWL